MKYRPEIDGLRALAIVPVILFHGGFAAFEGGFVGVDIFFVISGYLITAHILEGLAAGTFSFADFYERRARRILPALFLVALCSIPFAWMWMMPMELRSFSQSVAAIGLFISNLLFWRQSGYFDQAAELKPLLHTWSLAVEEQFYIVFPVILLLCWRFSRRAMPWLLAVIAIASLLLSEYASRFHPSFNFFWLPTRMWELMAGALCALLPIRQEMKRDQILSLSGLAAVVSSVFLFGKATPVPSLLALLPVLGTCALLLSARQGTIVGTLLSQRVPVGIGLISYSAYLWHQPLFAFARLRSLAEPSQLVMAGLAAVSLILAYFSWRFVEVPARRRGRWPLPRSSGVLAAGVLFTGLLVTLGVVGHMTMGVPTSRTDRYWAILEAGAPVSFVCDKTTECLIGDPQGQRTGVAFVGDSHMGRYGAVLDVELKTAGKQATLLFAAWCAPLLNLVTTDPSKNGRFCGGDYQSTLMKLTEDRSIHSVVLGAEWGNFTTGSRRFSTTSAYDFTLNGAVNRDAAQNAAEFRDALVHTIGVLRKAGKRVFVIAPVPEYEFEVPSALVKRDWWSFDSGDLRQQRAAYEARNRDVYDAFKSVAGEAGLIDVTQALCDTDYCYPFDDALLPLYSDSNHLSQRGLQKVLPVIVKATGL